jgi:cytochrome oxidase Cu insertion factor (SCO1/SenC/PrrC family)
MRNLNKKLQKVFKNLFTINKSECLDLLGDEYKLQEVSNIWDHNSDLFEIIASYVIMKYATRGEYNKKEIDAYRRGIKDFVKFFEQSNIEVLNYSLSKGTESSE